MATPNQIVIDSPTNTVEVQTNDNQLTIISEVCNTEVTVTQPTVTTIQVATPGPKGPQGPQGDISNQITTGSITASVDIGTNTFRVQNGSSIFFTINSSSNAGLGPNITVPTGEFGLSIYSSSATPHNLIVGTTDQTFTQPNTASVIIGGATAHLDLYNAKGSVVADELLGAVRFRSNDTAQFGITKAQIAAYATDTSPDGYLVFSTQQSSAPLGLAERMRITNTGLVGIGTTNPLTRLHISGSTSGSILEPTSSGVPTFTGRDGQFIFGSSGENHFIYVYMAGAWRSSSLL